MNHLNFKKVTNADAARLRRYYKNCDYGLCEYSVGTKLMWRTELHPAYAEACGCLLVSNDYEGDTIFDFPVPADGGDVDGALLAIERHCMDTGIPLILSVVPQSEAGVLLERYPYACVSSLRTWRDYVYEAEALRGFAGRRYSGQRNHINKFRAANPTASFRVLTGDDGALIEGFWAAYDTMFEKESEKAKKELGYAKRLLRQIGKPWCCVGGMERDGALLSLALGERCGDTLIIHVEKALYAYEGVYPTTVQAFAQAFSEGLRFINREDDAADRGLRTSKLQYLPTQLAPKYRFEAHNELHFLPEIPTLTTERLTLSAFTAQDAAAYSALCLDEERNRYWGYDDRAGVRGELREDSFLQIAAHDFADKLGVNFAVRVDGKCIGEVVVYRFDYRGAAEIGCRIAADSAGRGYGSEAFAAIADWALYHLKLALLVAKCYRENEPSRKMLASCMRANGEDETFFYFKKLV